MLDMLPQRPARPRMAEQVGGLPRRPAVASNGLLQSEVTGATRVRFETELWNALDARLRTEFDLPMTWFEPMRVIAGRPAGCSTSPRSCR
jgi:hypothetical protein